ncbi:MAG: hypothetical protein SGARI_004423 [Bacillariaceae sp.]
MNSGRAFGGLRADRVILKNCGIKNFGASGIGQTAQAGRELVFDNIVSTGNGNKGININVGSGETRFVTISNSKFDGNVREGARVESNVENFGIVVYDTSFNSNGEDGFRGNVRNKDQTFFFADIVANKNGENGIRIAGGKAFKVDISGSETNENGQRGIRINNASAVTINRSEACDNDALEGDINNADIRLPINDGRGSSTDISSEGVTCDDSRPNDLCDCTCMGGSKSKTGKSRD